MIRVALPAVLCLSCAHAPVALAPVPTQDLVARALPSVVLLVATNPKGPNSKSVFGAGLIVSHDSLVLTNRHVVAAGTLYAMRYAPEVVSYTPMDGGLDRFLYENSARLVPVELVRADETTDLALVRIATNTASVALLPLARAPARRGQTVLALGHPNETVWSFTSGVVSALHHGAIQHDAAINPGSSGGPLLNDRGEVIGLNTSRLFGDTNGVGFARPIELARWLYDAGPAPLELDRSSPEKAAAACIRAQELGAPHLVECFDWEVRWQALEASARSLPAPAAQLALDALEAEGGRPGWVHRTREALLDFVRNGHVRPRLPPTAARPPLPDELKGVVEATERDDAQLASRLASANGFKLNLKDHRVVRESIRKGVRIEASQRVNPRLAWVLLAGRNPDGTEYRFSEAWALQADGRWLQHWPATSDDLLSLPAWFAPPLDATDEVARRFQLELLRRVYEVAAQPRPVPDAAPPGPGDDQHLSGETAPPPTAS